MMKERLEGMRFARKGFTLIEILIVVAIIAILASIVLVGLGPTQQSGRDARRISDLHSIQTALELYYNKCGYYPGAAQAGVTCAAYAAGNNTYASMVTAIKGSAIGVTSIPNDPSGGGTYYYSSFTSGATPGGTYTLGTTLENANNSVANGYSAPANAPAGIPGSTCAFTAAQPNYCLSL